MDHRVRIVVALPEEAEPLRDAYDLTGSPDQTSYKVYQGSEVCLIVSGTGAMNAAGAVSHLYHSTGQFRDAPWLNLGLAGHPEADLGTPFLVDKVSDDRARSNWFPQILFESPCEKSRLKTVQQPESSYREHTLYDMEASGFCSSTTEYSTIELVHLLKIVSDNRENPVDRIGPDDVRSLIENQIKTIQTVVDRLRTLSGEYNQFNRKPEAFEAITNEFHFTFNEKVQLERLLNRWNAVIPDSPPEENLREETVRSSEDVLQFLRRTLENQS